MKTPLAKNLRRKRRSHDKRSVFWAKRFIALRSEPQNRATKRALAKCARRLEALMRVDPGEKPVTTEAAAA